jgi:hypothetical protein
MLQAASNQGLAMIRIGIVGVGFMGMKRRRILMDFHKSLLGNSFCVEKMDSLCS